AIDCACDDEEEKKPFLQSKTFLGVVTILAVLLLAFPYYSHAFFSRPAKTETVVAKADLLEARLSIKGMTCAGCESSVNHALAKQIGVVEASADYETGTAMVKYDASVVGPEAFKEVVESEVGYQVTNIEVIQQ
ncbi:MAG: cation transporter, partial [Bacteroidetes bacterium]|nr:cation transporter [Bacteroidota bacterium]